MPKPTKHQGLDGEPPGKEERPAEPVVYGVDSNGTVVSGPTIEEAHRKMNLACDDGGWHSKRASG